MTKGNKIAVKHHELIIQNNRIILMHKQQDKNVQLVRFS